MLFPKPLRRKKKEREPFPADLHAFVLNRDKECFLYKLDRDHVCRDRWGTPHAPNDLRYLTVDHVHLHAGGTKGRRADDRKENLVAMCHSGNVGAPSEKVREAERSYLRDKYPDYKP